MRYTARGGEVPCMGGHFYPLWLEPCFATTWVRKGFSVTSRQSCAGAEQGLARWKGSGQGAASSTHPRLDGCSFASP